MPRERNHSIVAARRPTLTVDRDAAVLLRQVDQNRRLATDAHALWLEQRQGEASRHTSIDRVAARFEHTQSDGGGQVMPGGDHAQGALQHRASSKRNRSGFPDSRTVRVDVGAKGACGRIGHGVRQNLTRNE
jgi:hypothetical protein